MRYFLITCGEDGIDIEAMTEDRLLEHIEPDEDGDYYYGSPLTFLDTMPEIFDGQWRGENTAVIIKGEIIVPKPVKIVTKMELT